MRLLFALTIVALFALPINAQAEDKGNGADQVRLVATAIRVQALARLMLLAGPGAKAVVVARARLLPARSQRLRVTRF